MNIVHVSAEYYPFAKVGGLADVVYGLSHQQTKMRMRVSVFIPEYSLLDREQLGEGERVYEGRLKNVSYSVVRYTHQKTAVYLFRFSDRLFDRDSIYGQKDDFTRFLQFSLACSDFLLQKKVKADVVHLHDWQAAYASFIIKPLGCKIVLTLHNLEHQGRGPIGELLQLAPSVPWIGKDEVNLLEIGIDQADVVVTVSPRYKEEILTWQGSWGLDAALGRNRHKLHGIINGLGDAPFNPRDDRFLTEKLQGESIQSILSFKKSAKKELQELLGKRLITPLIVTVSRLAHQKGLDFMTHLCEMTETLGCSYLILGIPATNELGKHFAYLKEKYRDSPYVHISLEFNLRLSHLAFAAADFTYIPSLFEPCGLTQMIGIRYKSIPIARATGGLINTIHDYNDKNIPQQERNGYLFSGWGFDPSDSAIRRALQDYNNKKNFEDHLLNLSKFRFSWDEPERAYFALYKS